MSAIIYMRYMTDDFDYGDRKLIEQNFKQFELQFDESLSRQ